MSNKNEVDVARSGTSTKSVRYSVVEAIEIPARESSDDPEEDVCIQKIF